MKKILFIILLIIGTSAFCQDIDGVEITTYVQGNKDVTESNANVLNNKMENFLTQNGIVKGINSQFVMMSSLEKIQSQEVGGGAGNMMMYELSLTTKILNSNDENVFAQTTQVIKGLGENKTRAINNALGKINFSSDNFKDFLSKAKFKIVDYYTKNCNRILAEATSLEQTHQFDYAIYKLTSIPPAADKCYKTAMSKAQSVFVKRINYDCKAKLTQAKTIWASDQSNQVTSQIEELLQGIDMQSSCYKEVNAFVDTVSKRIKEIDNREWNLHYKQQVGLEEDRIQAIKEIGKAYGAGQPKQIMTNTIIK